MTTPKTADAIKVQQARQDRLEELYHQDGRQSPDHQMHGLYTGLVLITSLTVKPMKPLSRNASFLLKTLGLGDSMEIRRGLAALCSEAIRLQPDAATLEDISNELEFSIEADCLDVQQEPQS